MARSSSAIISFMWKKNSSDNISTCKQNLIAFYGGTFDPIHYGHLYSVISLSKIVSFKKIILLPNNVPPHRVQPIASAKQRIKMIQLAISSFPNSLFDVDDREFHLPTPSWTVETFQDIRKEYGYDIPIGFIIGQDSLLTMSKWHKNSKLMDLCHILVCSRPGYKNQLKYLNDSKLMKYITTNPHSLYEKPYGLIYFASTIEIPISSSNIRKFYQIGRNCDKFLPVSVRNYIREQKLYQQIFFTI